MFEEGFRLYIEILDDAGDRTLHPCVVTAAGADDVTIDFDEEEEPDVPIAGEQELFVYYEREREFMQQPARVVPEPEAERVETGGEVIVEPKRSLHFRTTGRPLSAERRETYRVATVMANLKAAIAGEADCPLTDVSVTGFSVLSNRPHQKGEVLDVALRYEQSEYRGSARVQSIKTLRSGRQRYGLTSLAGTGSLESGQRHISMEVQRQQLKRRSD